MEIGDVYRKDIIDHPENYTLLTTLDEGLSDNVLTGSRLCELLPAFIFHHKFNRMIYLLDMIKSWLVFLFCGTYLSAVGNIWVDFMKRKKKWGS